MYTSSAGIEVVNIDNRRTTFFFATNNSNIHIYIKFFGIFKAFSLRFTFVQIGECKLDAVKIYL